MNRTVAARKTRKVTIGKLHIELRRLRRRVEDLEDLRDLNAAIERNAGKSGIPWTQVKRRSVCSLRHTDLAPRPSEFPREATGKLYAPGGNPQVDRLHHNPRNME